MLKTPAPFPQVGSFALAHHDRRLQLCRILAKVPDSDDVLIGFPATFGASGNTRAAIGSLVDGTPLSDGDRREWSMVESRITEARRRKKAPRQADIDRANELRSRDTASDKLADLFRKYEAQRSLRNGVAA